MLVYCDKNLISLSRRSYVTQSQGLTIILPQNMEKADFEPNGELGGESLW